MNSKSSQNSSEPNNTCLCGIPTATSTSHTPQNRGRHFRGCSRYRTPQRCDFFEWIDPPISSGSEEIICQLLDKVSSCEDEIAESKAREVELSLELFRYKQIMGRFEEELANSVVGKGSERVPTIGFRKKSLYLG